MFEARPSAIHGHGLFATTFIPADTFLGKLEGEITTEDGPHVLWIDGDKGLRVTCDLRYINHAHAPNAVYYDDLTVVALCDIQPGEEITHDYNGDDLGEEVDWDDEAELAVMA